jgi:cell division protein FtsA
MAPNLLVGLDIGTATIKVVVAENQAGRPVPRLIYKEPSAGMRRGVIVDPSEAAKAVSRALLEAKRFSKNALRNVYVNIGTSQIKVQSSRGIVAVSRADAEIYEDDINRVIKASQAVNLGSNRMMVHHVSREYIVDGVSDIIDPLGLSGNRLEVNSLIIDAFAPHVKAVMKAIELSGGQVGGLVLGSLAASRAALTKSQKDLGVLIIDIGAGTTGMTVYEENKLVGVAKFPVGSMNLANDIAIGLKISVAAAESIKLHHGYALAKDVNAKETIELKRFAPDSYGSVSRRFVAEIIESRLAEIFEFVHNELRLMGKVGQLAGGVVLVGGGAKLPGLTELVKQELKLSSQIAITPSEEWAVESGGFLEYFEDPEYTTALGLVLWGADQEHWRPEEGARQFDFDIKKWLRRFLP